MLQLPDTPFDDPLLNNAFEFCRNVTSSTGHAKLSSPDESRHLGRGRSLFMALSRGSPSKMKTFQRSGNVSEPQLISSTNYMRESWFTNLASARTVDDITNLSGDDDTSMTIRPIQSTTAICDTLSARSQRDSADAHLRWAHLTICEDFCTICGQAKSSDSEDEEHSLYSTDSADQDVHPLLLSMPTIPQIKLERKATVRKLNSVPSSDTAQNPNFLSPRVRDLRTPTRMSSRRYGCILSGTGSRTVFHRAPASKGSRHSAFLKFQISISRRFGSTSLGDHVENSATQPTYTHSRSEPILNSPSTLDNEQVPLLKKGTDESPHSDVLLSMIEEVNSSPGPYSDKPELGIHEAPEQKQIPPMHSRRSHKRFSMTHSISFNSIVQAVAGRCTSLDSLFRKPKSGLRFSNGWRFPEPAGNAHDPTSKWAPRQGQIIVKVFVPSTDDIWMFRVPQDIGLTDFTSKVVAKLGFFVSLSGSLWDEPKYYFRTDEQFQSWVRGRIRFGRNLPIVAHVPGPLPLVKLSVDGDSCEVWCYA